MKMRRACTYCNRKLTLRDDLRTYVCPRCGATYTFTNEDHREHQTEESGPVADDVQTVTSMPEIALSMSGKNLDYLVRREMASSLAEEIMKRMEIITTPMPSVNEIEYRARVRIVKLGYEFE